MKKIFLALALAPSALFAHEGHNPATTPSVAQAPASQEPSAPPARDDHGNAACVAAPEAFSELSAHLTYPKSAVHVHAYWKQNPIVGQAAILKLELRNVADHSLSSLDLQVDVLVSHEDAGHESTVAKINPFHDEVGDPVVGAYLVSKIDFSVGGTWSVKVKLTNPKGEVESNQFTVSL